MPPGAVPSPSSDPLWLPEGDAHPEAALGTLPRAQPEIPHFRPLPQPVHSQGEGPSRVFPVHSSGPNPTQGPPGSDLDPWPPLQREKRWSASSGGTAEWSMSSISTPGWVRVRVRRALRSFFPPSPPPLPGQPQPASPRATHGTSDSSGAAWAWGALLGLRQDLEEDGNTEDMTLGASQCTGLIPPALEPSRSGSELYSGAWMLDNFGLFWPSLASSTCPAQ